MGYISKPRLKCGHGNCYIASTLKDNAWHFISTCCLDLVKKKKKVFYIIWICILSFLKVYFFFQVLHENINVSGSQGVGLCAICYMFKAFYNTLVVQSPSHVWFFVSPWSAACQSSLSLSISWSLSQFVPIELLMPSDHLTLCCPLLLLPSNFPSIRIVPMSGLFASGRQHTGALALASVLPKRIQGWFPLKWLTWSFCFPGDSQEFSTTTQLESMSS